VTSQLVSKLQRFATMRATLLSWGLWMMVLVLSVAGISLWPRTDYIFFLAVPIPFATVGAVVASRLPANPIGWLFIAFGVVAAATFFSFQYAYYAVIARPGSLPGGTVMSSVGAHIWHPGFGFFILIFLLFPYGESLSRRWRPVAWIVVVSMFVGWLTGALESEFILEADFPPAEPLIAGPFADIAAAVFGFSVVFNLVLLAIAGASLLLRLRRAKGDERQQIKWFVFAVAVFAIALPLSLVFLGEAYGVYTLPLVPIAAGAAILRYRLYDIDIVINKALVFGALAAFITAIYVGVVVGIGAALGTTGGSRLELSIAATAMVAVAFQPVRERVQRFANRLVYGKRATPYEVMSEFTHSVASVLSVAEVLPRMAEAAAIGVGAARTRVTWLWKTGGRDRRCGPTEPTVSSTLTST
jgi:hypothetical protein